MTENPICSWYGITCKGNDHLALKLDDIWKPTQLESLQISATGITSIAGIGMATNLKELQ